MSVEREGRLHLSDARHYRSQKVLGSWVLSECERWVARWSESWAGRPQVWSEIEVCVQKARAKLHEGKVVGE